MQQDSASTIDFRFLGSTWRITAALLTFETLRAVSAISINVSSNPLKSCPVMLSLLQRARYSTFKFLTCKEWDKESVNLSLLLYYL